MTVLLPGDSWTKRGSHSTLGTLLPVVKATCEHKGADPGPASAGVVPVHPAPRAAGLDAETLSREWGRSSDFAGGSGERADEPQHKVGREIHQGKYVLVTKDLYVPCFVSP